MTDYNPYIDPNDGELLLTIIKRLIAFIIVALIVMFLTNIFCGCTVPRAVEEHHHHHYEADTLAVKSLVDRHVQSWHQQIDSAWREHVSQYLSQQSQSEQQHETVTETITESVDSLGRKIRQEQRTISRDISRELMTIEQQLTRTYELRLQQTVDSIDSVWQSRYDAIQTHWEQTDSTSLSKTPVAQDSRPWYKKLWDAIAYILIGVVLAAAAIWISRSWWIGWFRHNL